ncbi:hypothetical protein AA650_08950 [Anabaena sp. WA102]|nr:MULTISPECIES: DegT/DnrJ/EryC1/StrS family aminotransferase [unclassified Anabaena]ALB40581.1 hypothetical protein AA650_08950 [Anabaena sp. WA102]OBQ16466.1 MAG: hypothetical protein AN486_18990 [Anabaena sp. AL93]
MIPFVDLKAQYNSIKNEINAAVFKALESTQFVLGSEVVALEEEFSYYCDAKYGIAVNTGTSASNSHFEKNKVLAPILEFKI